MDEREIAAAAAGLLAQLSSKDVREPHVRIVFDAADGVEVWWRHTKPGSRSTDWDSRFNKGADVAEAVAKASAAIGLVPDAKARARQDAVRLTALALEAVRDADLIGAVEASLVSQLESMMKSLSENIIEGPKS